MGKTIKLSITLPEELLIMTDEIAKKKKINRSQVISQCLNDVKRKQFEEELKEGYIAMAEENEAIAKGAFQAQSEVVLKTEKDNAK